jgi:mobilization protein NikA
MDNAARITRSGTETRQRRARPAMRCTPSEYAQLEAAAERAGMTISAFMRHQCLGTAGPRAARRPPVERIALAQILAHMGKCGSNLNQIARVLNSGGDAPHGIPDAVADFRAVCAEIMRMLGRTEP